MKLETEHIIGGSYVRRTKNPIKLGDKVINLRAVAESLSMDQGHLSKILSGSRSPKIAQAKEIADALGFDTIESLMEAIESRRAAL